MWMAETVEIQMPQMGESVTEGTVLEWLKHEGEFVSEGETVVEVSTDKIDAEVPAPASGVITRILKGPDETIEVGGVLAELDPTAEPSADGASGNGAAASAGGDREPGPGLTAGATGEGDADLGDESAPSEATQPGATKTVTPTESAEPGESVQITMPEMGESVTEGTVLEWHVAEGQSVSEGDTVIEVSTDKIDAEVPAPSSGVITKLLVSADDTVQVGQALAEMTPGEPSSTEGEAAPAEAPAAAPGDGADGGRASPVARRVAAKNGVDLSAVHGSGPGGKVTKADVLAAANGGNGAAVAAAPPRPAPSAGQARPLRGPAGMLAQAMNESRSMPTATSFRTLPVDVLDAKRRALNGVLKERGLKVSFTHLVAWAIVEAAREWQVMARVYAEDGGKPQVVEPGSINLGIAVDVERKGSRSLMVPCIKGADDQDFAGFHSYYEELITKTRENKLTADDFQG